MQGETLEDILNPSRDIQNLVNGTGSHAQLVNLGHTAQKVEERRSARKLAQLDRGAKTLLFRRLNGICNSLPQLMAMSVSSSQGPHRTGTGQEDR